ncbi:hypothetical protein [Ottowia caeni]|uniref:hypothetical protein n=1 Tax=Ottowia caeni TaxID=2870339 RepID=UPI001E4F3A68|nr:hypothetical protein [Ottowia caeni]
MHKIFGLLALLFSGLTSAQVSCDCSIVVGSCQASISVIPTASAKGSYGAELKIKSTSPICSKVSYFLDNTPSFTIITKGNIGEDSVFGQKPVTRQTISEVSCQVCQQVGGDSQGTLPGSNQSGEIGRQASPLSGRWHNAACSGAPGWWGGPGSPRDVLMVLTVNDGSVSGSLSERNDVLNQQASLSGQVRGNTATLTSSWRSKHNLKVSPDGQILTDEWCNKDGGCATCEMSRN